MFDIFQVSDIMVCVSILYALVVGLYAASMIGIRNRKSRNRDKVYELLANGILNGTIYDSFGLEILCRYSQYEDFERFVRGFLKYALTNQSEENFHKIDDLMRAMIVEKSRKKPFEECNSVDRQFLLSINEVVSKSDIESAKLSVQELSRSIREKDAEIAKQGRQQFWLTILAIVGLVLNIFFGIQSMNLSEKDINNISQIVETAINNGNNDK